MDTTKIQIGDWVFVKPSMLPIKVAAVHHKKVGYHALANKLYWVRVDLLRPIPPTAEILEKNGFELRDEHFYLFDDYYDIDVWQYSDGIWIVRYDCCEMNMPSEIWTISYLHELQQFMRHCGIDKKIKL